MPFPRAGASGSAASALEMRWDVLRTMATVQNAAACSSRHRWATTQNSRFCSSLQSTGIRRVGGTTAVNTSVTGDQVVDNMGSKRPRSMEDCPICLEAFETRELTYGFDCQGVVHGVCDGCHARLMDARTFQCPVCRAPSFVVPPFRDDDVQDENRPLFSQTLLQPQSPSDMDAAPDTFRHIATTVPPTLATEDMLNSLQRTVQLAQSLFNEPTVSPQHFREIMRQIE